MDSNLKYANFSVVFQEIPNETTLSINITNCPCHCPACHSQYLWRNEGTPLTISNLQQLLNEYGTDITCVCFMGGDCNPQAVADLAQWLRTKYPHYKIAWYSGRQYYPIGVPRNIYDYYKLGPYIQHLGPLTCPNTNQKLFCRQEDGTYKDITSLFWQQKKN